MYIDLRLFVVNIQSPRVCSHGLFSIIGTMVNSYGKNGREGRIILARFCEGITIPNDTNLQDIFIERWRTSFPSPWSRLTFEIY